MLNIDIYSSGTSTGEFIKHQLKYFLRKANIKFKIKEVTSVSDFIKADITSIPTVIVKNKKYDFKQSKINNTLKNLIGDILYDNEYGDLDKIFLDITAFENYSDSLELGLTLAQKSDAVLIVNSFVKTEEARIAKQKKLDFIAEELNKTWIGQLDNYIFIESKVWLEREDKVADFICENYKPYFIITAFDKDSFINQLEAPCSLLYITEEYDYNQISKAVNYFDGLNCSPIKDVAIGEVFTKMDIPLKEKPIATLFDTQYDTKSIVMFSKCIVDLATIIPQFVSQNPKTPFLIY